MSEPPRETVHHTRAVTMAERRCTPGQPWRPDDPTERAVWKMVAHELAKPVDGDEQGRYLCPLCNHAFVPTPCP